MEYTATSFAEPLTRVFDDVLGPTHDLDVSQSPSRATTSRRHDSAPRLDDAFERHAYRPVSDGARAGGERLARRVPNGSMHRYLAFGLGGALIVVLVVVG